MTTADQNILDALGSDHMESNMASENIKECIFEHIKEKNLNDVVEKFIGEY